MLSNSAGNIHIVYYNEDILSPQIVCGWSALSDFYGFKDTHPILFRYVGHNSFHITVYMGEVCESDDGDFLKHVQVRELLNKGLFEHFKVKLSLLPVNGAYLVSLPPFLLIVFIFYLL